MILDSKLDSIKTDVVEKLMRGQIIPVIGDDVFFIKDNNEIEYRLNDFIVEKLVDTICKTQGSNKIYDRYPYIKSCHVFKSLTLIKRELENMGYNMSIILQKLYKEYEIVQRAYVSNEVLEFLTKRPFPLIITTSFSNILEHILEKYNGKYSKYKSVYYIKERRSNNSNSRIISQDIGEIDELDEFNRLQSPTIYHLFGSLSNGLGCVITENDFLQYLHCLHDTNSRPKNLIDYINSNRHILTIGCNIPDWSLRFLLSSFKTDGDVMSRNERWSFNGGVVSNKQDEELAGFLENIDYFYDAPDTTEGEIRNIRFISDINNLIAPEQRISVFVSVYSEDSKNTYIRPIISEIISELKKRYDVWFCEEQLSGVSAEQYWKKIRDGLAQCQYFIPIISYNVVSFIQNNLNQNLSINAQPDKEQGFITEWKYAIETWKTIHNNKERYSHPISLVNFNAIQSCFYPKEESEIINHLRQLFFNDNGVQIVDHVSKIKIE